MVYIIRADLGETISMGKETVLKRKFGRSIMVI